MVRPDFTHPSTATMRAINRELARVMHAEEAPLSFGADAALADDLVLCGILGGKDVGKSTLINALAEKPVSVDTEEVGRGTDRPMAYIHESIGEAVTNRLRSAGPRGSLDYSKHTADAVRNVVLIDLPDFDSEFAEHRDIVRAIVPLLDRILWVVTPRKIGDRAWVELLHDVVKDPSNVHCVLNKVDELLSDESPAAGIGHASPSADGNVAERFWREQHRWVEHWLRVSDCPSAAEHHFLIAAAYPDPAAFIARIGALWDDHELCRYAADRGAIERIAQLSGDELNRLRATVLSPVSAERSDGIKSANRSRERAVNVERIRAHYDLDQTIQRLADAVDPGYLQRVTNDAVGSESLDAGAATIRKRLRRDAELADELLEHRVQRWPLLRLVYWPFGWLSRVVGRRIGGGGRALPDGRRIFDAHAVTMEEWDSVGPARLADRVDLIRSRILADHGAVARALRIDGELPPTAVLSERATAALDRLPAQWDGRLLADLMQRERRPSILGKGLLWLIFLWFPFLQPVSEGLLEVFASEGTLRLAHGLYRVVSALSAVHLLAGFTVVGAIYLALIAGMYARALRAVRRARAKQLDSGALCDAVDEVFIREVVVPLIAPLQDRLRRLTDLNKQLEDVRHRP